MRLLIIFISNILGVLLEIYLCQDSDLMSMRL